MANIITGDKTKGIKYVGELALRISRFDSYRLFTLYENAKEKKPMDVSGSQKYYLVFRSPSKEIRIPEYDPKGFFEVDKINGCVLFKITKKNAEDILSMKTGGKKIFHIIRVFEETDEFGRVLNVTDEVEVYHGRWGDDEEFMTITTEAKVDLLTKSLAEQIEKNAELLNSYKELLENYNSEVEKTSSLEKESEALRAEVQSLETQLNEYIGDTYDGTILSTDTKYIAFENTLDNISYTEEQYKSVLSQLMTTGSVDVSGYEEYEFNDATVNLEIRLMKIDGLKVSVYNGKNPNPMYSCEYDSDEHKNDKNEYVLYKTSITATHGNVFKIECVGGEKGRIMYLGFSPNGGFENVVSFDKDFVTMDEKTEVVSISGMINYFINGEISEPSSTDNIGTVVCYFK